MKGWIFLKKFSSLFFLRDIASLEMKSNYFFIQLVFNFYLVWRKNSDHSQRGFNDSKMVSWLIISYRAFPLECPQIASMGEPLQCKPGAGLKGLAYGGYSLNKKHRGEKGPQLEKHL